MSTSTSTSTEAKKALVCIGHNRRVVTFSTSLEERIREAFSDILHNGESILLQVEARKLGSAHILRGCATKRCCGRQYCASCTAGTGQYCVKKNSHPQATEFLSRSCSLSPCVCLYVSVCVRVCVLILTTPLFLFSVSIIRFLPCNNTLINSDWTYM